MMREVKGDCIKPSYKQECKMQASESSIKPGLCPLLQQFSLLSPPPPQAAEIQQSLPLIPPNPLSLNTSFFNIPRKPSTCNSPPSSSRPSLPPPLPTLPTTSPATAVVTAATAAATAVATALLLAPTTASFTAPLSAVPPTFSVLLTSTAPPPLRFPPALRASRRSALPSASAPAAASSPFWDRPFSARPPSAPTKC